MFTNPELVYSDAIVPPYPYAPCIATLFAPIALLPFEIAHWIYLIMIYILAVLLLINFDKILQIKGIENKLYRLIFLISISNGLRYIQLFDYLTSKMWTAFFLILFIRREIEYRELNKDRESFKFNFTQWMILIFSIGISPQLFFLIFIYLFYNIKLREIFSKKQIQIYFLMILVFLIQNFMFLIILLISPESIIYFFGGSWRGRHSVYWPNLNYDRLVEQRVRLPADTLSHIFLVLSLYFDLSALKFDLLFPSLILMSFITLVIHFKKYLVIEEKFGYFALSSLFFNTMIAPRYYIVLLPFIAILLIDKLNDCEKFMEFVKLNLILILGLICIIILYFIPEIHYLLRVFPILYNVPIVFLLLRQTFVYIVLTTTIFILNKKYKLSSLNIQN